jgi:glycosyltransferase involved in cell wall biosynthesis
VVSRNPGRRASRYSRRNSDRTTRAPRVLIIVQNLPVPFDRRVWLECQALVEAGHDVSVVCPKGKGDPAYEVVDGVELYKYRPYAPGGSAAGFLLEYAYSFLSTARLALRARRGGAFDVLQACNPPDIFWPLALLFRLRDQTRFVFDHHDLCPELYRSRFSDGPSAPLAALELMERATMRTANEVISTNDSYAEIARTRDGKPADAVTVVRTGPDADRLVAGAEDPTLRRDRKHLVTYIGVMGPQDGVDIAVRAADVIVHEMGRDDVSFLLMGAGDSHADLVALRDELGLADHVELPGRVPDEFVTRAMSTADLGLSPDPKNPLNDVSTMNKTMEYMAFGLPVVAFDLRETRVSAADAAVYVEPNDVHRYAEAIVGLLDDPEERARRGAAGRRRVEECLAWRHQKRAYLGVYQRLINGRPRRAGKVTPVPAPRSASAQETRPTAAERGA